MMLFALRRANNIGPSENSPRRAFAQVTKVAAGRVDMPCPLINAGNRDRRASLANEDGASSRRPHPLRLMGFKMWLEIGHQSLHRFRRDDFVPTVVGQHRHVGQSISRVTVID